MKLRAPSRAASTLTLGALLLVATTIFAQQLSAPQSEDGRTARLVAQMLEENHISRAPVNDKIARALLVRYLKELDPQKLYFTAADVAEFKASETQLDDQIKRGDVQFAYTAFERYLKRLGERIDLAHRLIDANHDFTVDESLEVDADKLDWARTEAELAERWRKRIKYDLLSLKLADTPLDEARTQLHKRYKNIAQTMQQTEPSEQLEMYLSALAHCFDPHSSYMSPQTLEDFQIAMRLQLQGIGAALRWEDGYTIVAEVVKGGAAEADGRLKVGDKIIGVDPGDGEMHDVVEMKLSKVVRYIRGPKGTQVRLRVKPADGGEIVVYELTRQVIQLLNQEVKGRIYDAGERLNGPRARIGVINIPSFYRDFNGAQEGLNDFKSTARDVLKVLKEFRDQGGVDAVIVDLRNNGGGALNEAIEVTGLFIDQGPVVQVKEETGRAKIHEDPDAGMVFSGPLVVLCNRLSASASEIFAGAIKDYRRGLIVGDTATHGKGTVQNVMHVGGRPVFQFFNRETRGALKVTINQFYRVNGDSTQNEGVRSDIVLPSLIDHMDVGESFLENALGFNRIAPADFKAESFVNDDMVSVLTQNSRRRIASNPEFKQLQADIERFVERKARKSVSLNEEILRQERKSEGKDPESELDKTERDENDIFARSFYNDEVLHIAVDYAAMLRGLKTANN